MPRGLEVETSRSKKSNCHLIYRADDDDKKESIQKCRVRSCKVFKIAGGKQEMPPADTTMQVQAGEESNTEDYDEESEDEGAKYVDDGMEDGEQPILVNTKVRDSERAEAQVGVWVEGINDHRKMESDGWHCTYAPGSFRGERKVETPDTVLQLIKADRDFPGKKRVGLIMASSFHTLQTRVQDLAPGADMLLCACIIDLDAESHHAGTKQAVKAGIKKAIHEGATWQQLCARCPDFANVAEAARIVCAKLAEKGFRPVCWFTGGKGFRIVWQDPACYMRYRKGDPGVSTCVLTHFFKEYLSVECLAATQKLCDFDKCIYDAGKGVKSDLHQHQDTFFWPVLVDFSSAERLENMQMKRLVRDESLCQEIVAFWTWVFTLLPASWAEARPVPGDTGDTAAGILQSMKRGSRESADRGESSSRAAKKAKGEGAGHAKGTLSDKELEGRLYAVVVLLVQISPAQCSNYDDWMKVLFAVKDTMAGAGGADVHKALDAFSSIRPGYKGADDVARIYDQIQPRDDSQPRVTVATLVHFSRQSPALVLASQPAAKDRAEVQALLDAIFRLSERREATQSQCEEDLEKKLSEKRRELQRLLLGLLWRDMDLSKTHWLWLTQFCSCLLGGQDQEYIQGAQHHIIQEYGKRDVCITAGDLDAAWRQPKSRSYRNALVAYVQEELLRAPESTIEDSEPAVDGSKRDSIESGSTAPRANPHKRRKIAGGRASLLQAAQLLVQLPPRVLRQLLRHTCGATSRLLGLVKQHLRDPSESEKLVGSLQACSPSLVRVVAAEIIEAGEERKDEREEEREEECVPSPMKDSTLGDREGDDESDDDEAAKESLVLDEHSTLEGIVASHGELRLKEDWTTADLSPYQMHVALLQNLSPGVDWRLVVLWTCVLVSYQQQVKADKEAEEEDTASKTETKKKEAAAKKQAIEDEKPAAKDKKSADRAAAAAKQTGKLAVEKTERAQGRLAAAKEARRQAKTSDSIKRAKAEVEKADAKVKSLSESEQEAKAKAAAAVQAAEKADAILKQIQARSNCTDADSATGVAADQGVVTGKLPDVLEDYWEKIQGQHDAPTEDEVREEWAKTLACIMECEDSKHILLIGGALWSACFKQLFSYQSMKIKFERENFKVNDLKTYYAINSTGAPIQFSAPALMAYHKSEKYWGAIGPNNREIVSACYTLENHFRKLPLTNRWMEDPDARAFDRIDSIPPNREGITAPKNVCNTWPGFRAEIFLPVPEAEVASLVQPILDHLRVLFGRPEYFDYFLAWLAQMVQDPSEPTNVAILLKGQQGIGKDIIFDFFIKMVLGDGTGFKTSKPQEDVFGKHSVALRNRVFLLFDEVSGDDMRPLMSRLKDLITSPTVHINPKGETAYNTCNLSNILGTTNDQNPIHLEPQQRRVVVYECNPSKKGDVAYFQSLGAHLKRQDVARAFFQHLRDNVDVRPHTPFQARRPQTDAYLTMQQSSIPMLYKFLSVEVEHATGVANEKRTTFGGKDFFVKFQAWGREGHYSTNGYTISRFGTELGQLVKELTEIDPLQDSLVKRRANGGICYAMDGAKLRAHLQNTARYDPNAAM